MELSPVARYREPAYPAHEVLLTHPELLRVTPIRWQQHAALLSVLAASISLVTPVRAQEQSPAGNQPPIVTNINEPLIDTRTEPVFMGDVTAPPDISPQTMVTLTLTPRVRAIRKGNTIIAPVRLLAQHLGAQVNFDGKTSVTTITREAVTIILTPGRKAMVNGTAVALPARVRYHNNTLYAPARFLAETLGAQLQWHAATDEIEVIPPQGNRLSLEVQHRPRLSAAVPLSLDERRAALREYIAWLKAEEMI